MLDRDKVTTVMRHLIHLHQQLLDAYAGHMRIDHLLQLVDFIRYVQLVVTLEFQPAIVYLGEIIQSKTLLRC